MKKQVFFGISVLLLFISGIFAQQTAKTISGGVINGKAISLPAPAYPAAARAVGASGSVNVQVLIDEAGNVVSAEAVSGHPLLRSASEKAAREAKFKPTLLAGDPVKVSGVIVYVYNLPKDDDADSAEEEDIAFVSISASLRVMTRVNSDPKLSSVADQFFEVFGNEIAGEDLPEEMAPMKDLSGATPARRTEILADLNMKLKEQITGDEIWQFSVGEVLGDLMAESLKRSGVGLSEPAQYKINLLKLKNLMMSAPPNFPKDLLAKCREIAAFGDKDSLDDPDLLDQIDQMLEIIENMVLGED